MEVVKIRLQAQQHSLADPLETPKYRNAAHALYTIIREEGFGTLYRGVALTALRQATNQAANFTAYQELRQLAQRVQETKDLPSWETATMPTPSRRCRTRRRSRIPAWVTTSRAETGSSQISRSGRPARARAIATRCR